MKPEYYGPIWTNADYLKIYLEEIEWVTVRDARKEYFMAERDPGSDEPVTYTYGTPPHDKTYVSGKWHAATIGTMWYINERFRTSYNVCFLNRYDTEQNQLGWHSDDSPGMLHEHPIAVVSFGEPREIWWREKGQTGVIPAEQRQLLENGSLFVMPPGFQKSHQHRIPKGGKQMGPRVSLTFRRYVP